MISKKLRVIALMISISLGSGTLSAFGESRTSTIDIPDKHVYLQKVDPKEYRQYDLRPFKTPTYETFGNRLRLDWTEEDRNEVMRLMNVPTSSQAQEHMRMNRWVYTRGGKFTRIPGIHNNEPHIESQEYVDQMKEIMGEHYLGKVVGEVDGGWRQFNPLVNTILSRDKLGRYYDFQEFIEPFEDSSKGQLITLHNVGGYHPWAKENTVKIIGTQNFSRSQSTVPVQFAFARGAGKQYGVLWSGQYSGGHQYVDGLKSWDDAEAKQKEIEKHNRIIQQIEAKPESTWTQKDKRRLARSKRILEELKMTSPEKGVGISIYRNYLYSMYLYNSAYVTYETGPYIDKKTKELSPIGEFWRDANSFIERNPDPGVMQTPVAVLGDFGDGFWRSPEIRKNYGRTYITWDSLPYDQGNWMMHNTMDMIHPGYRNANQFQSQRYEFPATPYGDIADVLLSDVNPELLKQYSLITIASKIESNTESVREKLDSVVKEEGRSLILTGDNASKLWPEWGINSENKIYIPRNSSINIAGESITESKDGHVLQANNIPAEAKIVGDFNGLPVVYEIPYGNGNITLIMSPYGMNSTPLTVNNLPDNAFWNEEVQFPYEFMDHVKYIMDKKFEAQKYFDVDNSELRYIVCAKSQSEYTLGIINGTPYPQDFEIISNIGEIDYISELSMDDQNVEDELGFLPEGYHETRGDSDYDTIQGGGIKLFNIRITNPQVDVIEKSQLRQAAGYETYTTEYPYSIKNQIMRNPDFDNEYGYIGLTEEQLISTDKEQMKDEIRWINDKGYTLKLLRDSDTENDGVATVRAADFKRVIEGQLSEYTDTATFMEMSTTTGSSIGFDFSGITVSEDNSNKYLALREKDSISSWLEANPEFFQTFKGVVIDSEYIANRGNDAWVEEANRLEGLGIDIVVDFTDNIKGFDQISFTPEMFCYEDGMRLAQNVMDKMNQVGINQCFITGHLNEYKYQEEGMKEFIRLAQEQNIMVNLVNHDNRDKMNLSNIRNTYTGIKNSGLSNVRVAINTLTSQGINSSTLRNLGGYSDFIFLGSPGDTNGLVHMPFAEGTSFKNYNNSIVNNSYIRDKMFIFDGGYTSWDEIKRDVEEFERYR